MALLLCASAVFAILLLAREHEALRASGPGAALFLLGVMLCAGLRYGYRAPSCRRDRTIRDLSEYIAIFALMCVIGAVASYPAAAASTGMVDPLLQHADRLLHFDWLLWYRIVADHRALQIAGSAAYESIYLTPAIVLGYFAWANRSADAYRFLLSFWVAALITLVLFRWLPAAGPFAYLWHGPIPYMPQSALYQARLIPILQHHELRLINVDALHGLVSAPSFHAASGMLYIIFAWQVPRLRWPLIALNLLMIAATPVEGTHYLIDVIAGVAVAIAAFCLTRRFALPEGARQRRLALKL
jgi:membrane-associated phospholipid phosphatase